jgi:hypothetical protein
MVEKIQQRISFDGGILVHVFILLWTIQARQNKVPKLFMPALNYLLVNCSRSAEELYNFEADIIYSLQSLLRWYAIYKESALEREFSPTLVQGEDDISRVCCCFAVRPRVSNGPHSAQVQSLRAWQRFPGPELTLLQPLPPDTLATHDNVDCQ